MGCKSRFIEPTPCLTYVSFILDWTGTHLGIFAFWTVSARCRVRDFEMLENLSWQGPLNDAEMNKNRLANSKKIDQNRKLDQTTMTLTFVYRCVNDINACPRNTHALPIQTSLPKKRTILNCLFSLLITRVRIRMHKVQNSMKKYAVFSKTCSFQSNMQKRLISSYF